MPLDHVTVLAYSLPCDALTMSSVCLSVTLVDHDHIGWNRCVYYGMRS